MCNNIYMNKENPFNKFPTENEMPRISEEDRPLSKEGSPVREKISEVSQGEKKPKQITPEEKRAADKISAEAVETKRMLDKVLSPNKNAFYSETLVIKGIKDGIPFFDSALRYDGSSRYLWYGNTPAELRKITEEIHRNNPGYEFAFNTDPGGKWMEYTVFRREEKRESRV